MDIANSIKTKVAEVNWEQLHKITTNDKSRLEARKLNSIRNYMLRYGEKIGFLDIEASNLSATFGIVLTYCIGDINGKILKRQIDFKDWYAGRQDKMLMKQFIEDAKLFDRFVVHYGGDRRFDIPFLRTRAVFWGLDFPEYKDMCISDTWVMLKNKFKLHSNRLETACTFYGIESKGHKMQPDIWAKLNTGNPKLWKPAMDYIMVHNVEDVVSLRELYVKINKYSNNPKTSI